MLTADENAEKRNKMKKRIFLIVLDSFGIGEEPDAALFGDCGSNTLAAIVGSSKYCTPNLQKLGLFNIDGVTCGEKAHSPAAAFARLQEASMGKDTTVGHWEIAGVESKKSLPTFPEGFPPQLIEAFEKAIGRKTICNMPYSGTAVLRDFGEEHLKTGALIVYTSADSVFQIAANEAIVPVPELYRCCEIARELLTGDVGVGRVIARPFVGETPKTFKRTANRHDYSLAPPAETMLDVMAGAGLDVIGVGKIFDIFNGKGITEAIKTTGNTHGMEVTLELAKRDFEGLAFVNLVDFDMLYGHRNDVDGYANAAAEFDMQLDRLLPLMQEDDLLIITADHGCDPKTPSTDHSREYVPLLIYGRKVKPGVDLKTQYSFSTIAKTVCEYFGVEEEFLGKSLLKQILQ